MKNEDYVASVKCVTRHFEGVLPSLYMSVKKYVKNHYCAFSFNQIAKFRKKYH